MKRSSTKRYCVDRRHLKALEHDGVGWGHEMESGCFTMDAKPKSRSIVKKIKGIFK